MSLSFHSKFKEAVWSPFITTFVVPPKMALQVLVFLQVLGISQINCDNTADVVVTVVQGLV